MKALRWIFVLIAVVALALLVRVYFYGPAKGWFYRTFQTPAILHSAFIEDFDRHQAQTQRERLLRVFQSRTGSYGLHKTTSSIEGTPIGENLIIEDGHLTIVSDYTRDKFGIRKFTVQHPTTVMLGPVEESEGWQHTVTNTFLKCYINSKLVYRF